MSIEISFENAHPNAQKLMPDEYFYSVIDQNAPFGDDDSWETFMAFREWLERNPQTNKLEFINDQISYGGYPEFNYRRNDLNEIERYISSNDVGSRFLIGIDQAIIATAFGQLYLKGVIDLNLRAIAKLAIERQLRPELLHHWDSKEEREQKLKVLSKVLSASNS